ncbi:Putative Aldehyde dehydrogenase [Vibrio nigripulchritudo SFn27]|uniref:Putative Aldehyde dehydrogenase n=1 Tax=Vibrio nigripulchritudo TaxID=28173 RepID=U4K3G9_9VIBR|nr:aldehyde dehydrogenase family protein [Vibrio nigripulchritudo]CCN83816.1 Putative Aldehyde dehydrogenase [Vibrio nigripulchritudo BLFn1]CCN87176.1 Putative Aldehyde dehydrogenase [Vibrio nigripulchritudo SFn27]CCN94532.1 Putative Aldehyde dehydrogenase [Vibrio nigripulchritudo ENn2]CCO40902.1 Putative Aldehyde dehydrogenase [Vibrio nigripulchritudo SFn135]CCO54981.1 Putative Aldehyde dehydrogenase [Vibrio nigripulchritudo Wn13]
MLEAVHLINGLPCPEETVAPIKVINPSTGEPFAEIARGTSDAVNQAVIAAQSALDNEWGDLEASERGALLLRLSSLTLKNVDYLAELESKDVGKPLKQSRADVIACARYFEFYGGAADKIHGQTIPFKKGYTVMTLREPHGVTAHIIPWNYPMQIIGRSVGASLAMGNACVVKPGEDASLTSLFIGQLAIEAGFPKGALNVVTGLGREAGAALAMHPGVQHISFTGSNEVGTLIQKYAADNTIPVTLELGGKSPQLVFADADLDKALPFLVNASIQNAGQTCSCGSRILIEDSIYDEVVERVAEEFGKLKVGPANQDIDVGPVINAKQRDRVNAFIAKAKADGLPVLATAKLDTKVVSSGYYVQPTFFGDVPPNHPLAQEEVFGPVLAAIRFKDEREALEIANGTPYGLVAGVWTRDGSRQLRLAHKIEAGQVFINNYGAAGGVELPFGGVKGSGHGREKGFEALYGFSAPKTVALKHD